jgi:hypothetical protein
MKISRSKLSQLIENMLFENLAETSYTYKDGVYTHKEGDKQDPYSYKVVGGTKGTNILVKIVKVGKATGQKKVAKVGAKFKIGMNNMRNINVSSLYAAIAENQPEYSVKGAFNRREKQGGDKYQGPQGTARGFVIYKDVVASHNALVARYKRIRKGDSKLLTGIKDGKPTYHEGEPQGSKFNDISYASLQSISKHYGHNLDYAKIQSSKNGQSPKKKSMNDTFEGIVDALKPVDVVHFAYTEPRVANNGASTDVALLLKLSPTDFTFHNLGFVNWDPSVNPGKETSGEKNVASEKDGPSGLGTSMKGGSMAVQESFGRRDTKNFMRGLLTEAYDEDTPGTSRDPSNKVAIKIENKPSPTGAENQVFVMLRDTIAPAKIDNVYYIWDQWNEYWDGAPQELGKRGSELGISGDNDPYTYAKEGNMFRVVTGPKPGPIGKKFKPKSTKIGSEKEDDDIIDDIEKIFASYSFGCKPDSVDQYKEKITGLALQAIKSGDASKLFEEIPQAVGVYRGKNATSWSLPDHTKWVWLFSTSCSGDYGKATSVYQDVLDALQERGINSGALPFPKGEPIEGTVSEGLSRGSLYRRRYYGRY